MMDDKDKCPNVRNESFFTWLSEEMWLKTWGKTVIWLSYR